ncbi:MAG TPA: AraC family transcriptional regulator [Rubrobacteraceae bacterium]|nr:AraC family transcriptional regulator [Rubrobacteraceae bacterium]
MGRTRMLGGGGEGPPVYAYEAVPGVPPVSVLRFLGWELSPAEPPVGHAHSHEFLVLAYFERGGGSVRLADSEWRVEAGDAYVIAPGEVIGAGDDASSLHEAEGWTVFFPPEALGSQGPGPFLSWRSHPLLFPFVRGASGGAQRLRVPPAERPAWSGRFSALDAELRLRQDGYREAALSYLTLLLVGLSRLAVDVAGDFRLKDQPLLAGVFAFIEESYREPISLKDAARAVGLTPGHLTTVVRRKTGRTVQEWIAERRMAEARKLLVQTDLTVEEVGRSVGYRNAGYFAKHFRRAHGTTPVGWRRAGRP